MAKINNTCTPPVSRCGTFTVEAHEELGHHDSIGHSTCKAGCHGFCQMRNIKISVFLHDQYIREVSRECSSDAVQGLGLVLFLILMC